MYFVGCFIALPHLYPDTAYVHQVVGTFLLYQIVVNWWFLHITDSSFNSSEHPKENLAIGPYPFKVRVLLIISHKFHHKINLEELKNVKYSDTVNLHLYKICKVWNMSSLLESKTGALIIVMYNML